MHLSRRDIWARETLMYVKTWRLAHKLSTQCNLEMTDMPIERSINGLLEFNFKMLDRLEAEPFTPQIANVAFKGSRSVEGLVKLTILANDKLGSTLPALQLAKPEDDNVHQD